MTGFAFDPADVPAPRQDPERGGRPERAVHPASGGWCWACHKRISLVEFRDHEDCQPAVCSCCGEVPLAWDRFTFCARCDAPSVGPDMPRLKGRKDRWWL